MSVLELALQRNKYKHLTDDEWRWFLQQVAGRERTADKLPTFAAIEDWWYPVRLSCEQCSSEETARYKSEIIHSFTHSLIHSFLDLTGGYGVDTYFMSEQFERTDYVEQNEELCRIAEHNFSIIDNRQSITVHNTSAEEFLSSLPPVTDNPSPITPSEGYDLIFLDPARRDSHGSKVFRLEDCTPNVIELLPTLVQHLTHEGRIMLKLSPMLDLTKAIKSLSTFNWDIHVVALKNEVKEVLLLSGGNGTITAIDLAKKDQVFVFTRKEENLSAKRSVSVTVCQYNGLSDEAGLYLYEPNAAILKAGAYKLIAERFNLHKLDVNTHLYASDALIPDFPGRVWKIKSPITNYKLQITNANVLVRNYPLTPDQLKKKLHLRDGGTDFVIGCRVNGKPTVFLAERTEDIH